MGRRRGTNYRAEAQLILLPFKILFAIVNMLLAIVGFLTRSTITSSNFARAGAGGRFRRVTPDEVDHAIRPVTTLVARAEELPAKSGIHSIEAARALVAQAQSLAAEIDAACDAFDAQNFSFAHKRTAARYRVTLADARGIAANLRKTRLKGAKAAPATTA
jgi:hypothetical protein